MENNLRLALLSLDGLSLGDAFGEQFFYSRNIRLIYEGERKLPSGIWRWTDDTHMALSVVEMLREEGEINPDRLIKKFAFRFSKEPFRGYGRGAARLLRAIAGGNDWREITPFLFKDGSYGNGAAMRVAPLGAFFKDDLQRVVTEARKSAMVTHYHPEGQAGAIAVAVAAALAARGNFKNAEDFIDEVLRRIPESKVKSGIEQAKKIPEQAPERAIAELGTGKKVSAQDTVPFCIWCAAHYGNDFEEAMWVTVSGLGDCDTTCAIVGGIVALSCGGVPKAWLKHREPLEG